MDGVETSGRDEQQQLTRNHGGLFEHQPLSLKKFFMQKYWALLSSSDSLGVPVYQMRD